MTTVGIDLGTSNSCVSIWRNGQAKVIQNKSGSRTTPSIVAFCHEDIYIGKPAITKIKKIQGNVIYDIGSIGCKMASIGIDLGTSNSCMAIWRNERTEVIPNVLGKRLTPSVVAFTDTETCIGKAALTKMSKQPLNTIHGVKYLMGRSYNDPYVLKIAQNCGYNIITSSTTKNNISIPIKRDNRTVYLDPITISGLILNNFKKEAQQYLDKEITSVVITVPSYFSDASRQATINAGIVAGFQNVNLLNEPTAAALLYGIENKINNKIMLVFDFGGGTFDVSIVKCVDGIYGVVGIDGKLTLGGNDITENLVKYTIENMKKKNPKVEIAPKSMHRIRNACETAKINLTVQEETDIELELIKGFGDFELNITRSKFNELNECIFKDCLQVTENCIRKAKLQKTEIDVVVMVGGSSRIPMLHERINKYFGKEPKCNTNADECVALGAAVMAHKLYEGGFDHININQLCAYSLGVETAGNKFSVIIPKNSNIPIKESRDYYAKDNMGCTIEIFSGEEEFTINNTRLGEIDVTGIHRGLEGWKITVTFEIDINSVLQVTVVDENGKSEHLKIKLDKGYLNSTELTIMHDDVSKLSKQIVRKK